MKWFNFWALLVIIFQLAKTQDSAAQLQNAPDVLIFLIDDMGHDFGYLNPIISTQTINKFAEVRLTKYYTHPTCTPSRAALLTALPPEIPYAMFGRNSYGYSHQKTLPMGFKQRGYRTKGAGKWHLGHALDEYTPCRQGFDEWDGIYLGGVLSQKKQTWVRVGYDMHHDTSNGTRIGIPPSPETEIHTTELFTNKIIDTIKLNYKEPLFLYAAYTAVHIPIEARDQDLEKCRHIKDITLQNYCGMLVGLDEALKNITDAHSIYRKGRDLIIFGASDNAARRGGGSNFPFRGYKGTLWEGGLRVPAFLKAKNLPKNIEFSEMVHVTDIAPTLLRLVDEQIYNETNPKLLPSHGLDSNIVGRDITDAIRNNLPVHNELLLHHDDFFNHTAFIKQIANETWKIIIGPSGDGRSSPKISTEILQPETWLEFGCDIIKKFASFIDKDTFSQEVIESLCLCASDIIHHTSYGNPKLCQPKTSAIKLFNLASDPTEKYDLADKFPEIVKQLVTIVEKILKTLPPQKDFGRADLGFRTIALNKNSSTLYHAPWIPDGEDVESRPHTQFIKLEFQRFGRKLFFAACEIFLSSIIVACTANMIRKSPRFWNQPRTIREANPINEPRDLINSSPRP